MQKSLEKILKILNVEIQGKYTNRAIIGGLDKYFPNWIGEARTENIPAAIIDLIHKHCNNYAGMDLEERERSTKNVLAALRSLNANRVEPISTNSQQNETPISVPAVSTPSVAVQQTTRKEPPKPYYSKPVEPETRFGLDAPVSVIRGIGPSKSQVFADLGVKKIQDLFYYFPRRYDDYSNLKPINRVQYGEDLTIIATVQSHLTTPLRGKNQARVEVIVSDGTGFLRLVFFRSLKYISSFENHYRRGTQLVISGKVTMYLGRLQINNPTTELLDSEHLNTNGIIPVYPLVTGISQKEVRSAIKEGLKYYKNKINDYLPDPIREAADLEHLNNALDQVHYPDNMNTLKRARERLAFDEVFFLQLGVQQQKRNWHAQNANKFPLDEVHFSQIVNNLPFTLTNAQQRVIEEVRADLNSGFPMNRLIQGDVGSGKTIVAAIASAAVNTNGAQTAFMAPTSILAEQHYQSLQRLLACHDDVELPLQPSEIHLLTGDTSTEDRQSIAGGLQDGSIKLIIGTHALIEDPVVFQNLQLAIIDEQHRFGIAQRSALRQKGTNPHLLVMSATPIPRSLALTLFGDLDISVIDEMPAGRKPVETSIIHPFAREKAYQAIRGEIKNGHQAFIIYPLIDQGEDEDSRAAVDEHERLQKEVFPEMKLGLLHGRMPAEEKDRVMTQLREGVYDILVSTTVIEVGVDVPNATVMLIEGANRFGLAQLHQLRGRVGRGGDRAFCFLIPENEDAIENERLAAMTDTNDGFILAEKDLSQRGPGDFIGYRQSGYADLRMASITDIHLIEKARDFAQQIFKDDPMLESPDHQPLAAKLAELWQATPADIS